MKLLKLLCCFCPPVPTEQEEMGDVGMSRAQAVGKKKANPSKKKMRKEAKRLKHQMNDMKKKEVMMDMEKPMDMVEVAKEAADAGSKALQQPTTTTNLTTGAEEPVERVTQETTLDHSETVGTSSVSSPFNPCDLLAALNSVASTDGDIVALLDHLKAANMTHMAVESRLQLRQPAARVNVDRPGVRQPAARVSVDRESPMGGKPALRQPTPRLRLDTGPERMIPKETLEAISDNPQADGSMVNGGQCSTPAVDAPHSAVAEAVIAHPCVSNQSQSDLSKDRAQLAECSSERCPSPDLCEHHGLQQPEMGLTAAVTGEMSAGGGAEDEAEEQA
ncbi:uncharacterized protein LOC134468389 [Engraulis encrasicolus]|uniref:uncharacterized protein LOC134468389 n=1 Tax=Engraulis encrasicolus TaxID=184585 RepID=UPI002FD66D24